MFILNKKLILVFGIAVLAAVVVGANYILRNDKMTPGQVTNTNDSETAAVESLVNKPSPFAGRPVSELPQYLGRPLGEVRYGQGFDAPAEAVEKKRDDLKVLAAVLSANSMGGEGVSDWIAVGIIKKFFNDYEGARDAWEYANILYPNNGLSFANLGNLYGFYLHDNAKAEFNLKKAIANDPYQSGYYLSLADFYKTVYVSKKSEAPKILLEGMNLIKDVNLALALAAYYRDEGDKTNAIKYYEEVLKIAPEQTGVREEIERLK